MKSAQILLAVSLGLLLTSCQPEHETKPNVSPVDTTACDVNGLLERHQLMQNMRTVVLDPDFQMGVYDASKPNKTIINPKVIYQSFSLLEAYNTHLIKYKSLNSCKLNERNTEIFGENFSTFKKQISALRTLIYSYTLVYSTQFDANPILHKPYNEQGCSKPAQDSEQAKSDYERDVYYAKVTKDVSTQAINILKNEYIQLKLERKQSDFLYMNSMINYFCVNYDYTDPKEECTKSDDSIKPLCEEVKTNEKIYGGVDEK